MKNILFSIALLALLIAGCKSAGTDSVKVEEEIEIQKLDSLTTQMDSIKTDLVNSAQEVDELVNDL